MDGMIEMTAVEALRAGDCRVECERQEMDKELALRFVDGIDLHALIQTLASEQDIDLRGVVARRVFRRPVVALQS